MEYNHSLIRKERKNLQWIIRKKVSFLKIVQLLTRLLSTYIILIIYNILLKNYQKCIRCIPIIMQHKYSAAFLICIFFLYYKHQFKLIIVGFTFTYFNIILI